MTQFITAPEGSDARLGVSAPVPETSVQMRQPAFVPSIERVMGLMPGFVYVFSHDTHANEYTNKSVAKYLGYSPEEIRELGSDVMMRIINPQDIPAIEAHMARIFMLGDDETATIDYRVTTKEGGQIWLRSVDSVFDRAADGTVLRHVGCATDITAEKHAQEALSRNNAALEKIVAARTADLSQLNAELEDRIDKRSRELQDAADELMQLTYVATHDLKVPVNKLSRLSLMLKEARDDLSAVQAEQVGWIADCANQLSGKIQGLVLVAQIRLSERLPAKMIPLHQAVEKSVAACENAMGHGALPVIVDVPQELAVTFAPFELNNILASFIDNAVKYAEPARPLQITIRGQFRDGVTLLDVADNGTGLDVVRDRDKVFDLFKRAHKKPAGSGISLYCARRMMHQRGGEISVAGARGTGATFTLKFANSEATA